MKQGLYSLFLKKLNELGAKKKVVLFKEIYNKICPTYSITKQECLEVLFTLKDFGVVEVIKEKGVKIKDKSFLKEKIIKSKIRAEHVPLTCINKCEDCGKDFEAKVEIQKQCKKCLKELKKRIDKRVEELKKEDPSCPEWMNLLRALMIESDKK